MRLEDLDIESISKMSISEALELLRLIRLRRRTSDKIKRESKPKTVTTKIPPISVDDLSEEQAAQILALLEGKS